MANATPSFHDVLVAATVYEIDLEGFQNVEIKNVDGSAAIVYTTDGQVPVTGAGVGGVLEAVAGAVVTIPISSQAAVVKVKLISTGTPHFAVRGK